MANSVVFFIFDGLEKLKKMVFKDLKNTNVATQLVASWCSMFAFGFKKKYNFSGTEQR